MATLDELRLRKPEVMRILARYRAGNPRVFGSVARGQDRRDSDIDLLVDLPDDLTLFDVAALQLDLEALLQRRVDLVAEKELHPPGQDGRHPRRHRPVTDSDDLYLGHILEAIEQIKA